MKKTLITIALTLGLIFASTAAVAGATSDPGWRSPPVSRLSALDTELAPVLNDTVEIRSLVPQSVMAFSTASRTLDVAATAEAGAKMDAAFEELGRIADAGLAVLERFTPEPCFADYYSVMRTGYLLLGEAAANPPGGAQMFNLGTYLILDYGGDVHSIIDCG